MSVKAWCDEITMYTSKSGYIGVMITKYRYYLTAIVGQILGYSVDKGRTSYRYAEAAIYPQSTLTGSPTFRNHSGTALWETHIAG